MRLFALAVGVGIIVAAGAGVLLGFPLLVSALFPPPPTSDPAATAIFVLFAEFAGIIGAMVFYEWARKRA